MEHLEKPPYSNEIRQRALAVHIARQLLELPEREFVEAIMQLETFPSGDPELKAREIEEFINDAGEEADDNRFEVRLGENLFGFRTQQQAYWFFCETYKHTLINLDIIRPGFYVHITER